MTTKLCYRLQGEPPFSWPSAKSCNAGCSALSCARPEANGGEGAIDLLVLCTKRGPGPSKRVTHSEVLQPGCHGLWSWTGPSLSKEKRELGLARAQMSLTVKSGMRFLAEHIVGPP